MLERVVRRPAPAAFLVAGAGGLPVILFGGLLVLSLLPVLATPIPAMLDYPNHLARMFLLSRGGGAHPHYQVAWGLYSNLAMDLTVPQLARLMSVESATRLFLLVAQLLVVSGAMAIEWAVKRRFELAGFAALLFLYSMPFAWGFVNFQFGLGLALWGIALWLLLAGRSLAARFGLHCLMVAVLFAAHFFALGIYGFTIGVIELWAVASRRAGLGDLLARFTPLALPPLVVLGLMIWLGGSVGGAGTDWLPLYKPRWIFSVLSGYNLPLSIIGTIILIALVYVLARHGMLRLTHAGPGLAAGFALLYVAMPFRLFDTAFVDVRVIVTAALVLPGFVTLSLPGPRWRIALASLVIGLTLLNLASVARVWTSYRADYAEMIDSFRLLDRGSRVLIGHTAEARHAPQDLLQYPIYHAPTLAVHFADAFVPNLFTGAGKQPVATRAAVRHLDMGWIDPIPVPVLGAALKKASTESTSVPYGQPFLRDWSREFDYLYLLGPARPNPMPALLTRIHAGSQFVLYRIVSPPTDP